jgi:hypothetical protein
MGWSVPPIARSLDENANYTGWPGMACELRSMVAIIIDQP